ncbi:MLX-interacting protein [Mobula birostris]|uniref:MLX-interacting protein n=1 Tax=Mobula birostris TaxID=1983395 RepID=UPI003B289253
MARDEFLLRSARAPVIIKQEPDDDSDADEPNLKKSDELQIIHSGHFMVSSPHREHPPKKGYDFDTVNKQTCQTYCFGPYSASHLSIDASLTKLFECMTLAYSGKLVSPKWKNFKGLKLLWRDKIRLNNAIWRAWYMQYVEKRDNPVCHFVTPLDGTLEFEEPRKPEAATEGKFWKRRIEIVIREYHKWRTYFKKRLQKHKDEDLSSLIKLSGFDDGCPETCCISFQDDDLALWRAKRKGSDTPVPMEEDKLLDMDMLMSEFSDTLFSTLSSHHAVAWPNPREIAHAGNADMIQPGLIPLQPNLDFMDTFEPFQDLFPTTRFPSLAGSLFSSPVPPAPSVAPLGGSSSPSQDVILSTSNLSDTISSVSIEEDLIPSPVPSVMNHIDTRNDSSSSKFAAFVDSEEFQPQTVISNQETFLPLFSSDVPSSQTPQMQQQKTSKFEVPPSMSLNAQTFLSPGNQKFTISASPPPAITHTASSTFTQIPAATTFTQNQNLHLATKQQGVPCNVAMQPPKTHTTFAVPKAGPPAGLGSRTKQLQKFVPAKSELVPIAPAASPNAFLTQLLAPGSSAVLVTPTHLKAEGVLTCRVTQPSVVITPAAIATASGVTDFHHSILVGPAQQPGMMSTSRQTSQHGKSAMPHLFAASVVPSTVRLQPKTEQITAPASNRQAPSPTPTNRERQNSGQGSPASSERIPSPQSPINNSAISKPEQPVVVFKSRRMTHISAEQKRRFNIKMGFDTLHNLVTTLKCQSNIKPISNAVTLQKTVEYIAKLQQERAQLQDEAKRLREEIEELNISISICQQQLPATGVPVTQQRSDRMREMFDEYVKSRTHQNWKFWIFSIIIKPLFDSFNTMVTSTSVDDLCKSTLSWVDQHCSLPVLRPMVLNTLRHLSTTTSILTDPSLIPEQAIQAVNQISKSSGES